MSDELVVATTGLDTKTAQIAKQILEEEDVDAVKDLTHLFNLNQAKKNVLRIMKLNGLLDTVSDKIIERFEKYPDNFNNADLLNYLQVTQNAIDKANKNLSLVDDTPVIQVNNTSQVNVNIVDSYDRDSKERVLAAIKSIIEGGAQVEAIDTDFIELKEEDNTDE
jgi:hypothetical protein